VKYENKNTEREATGTGTVVPETQTTENKHSGTPPLRGMLAGEVGQKESAEKEQSDIHTHYIVIPCEPAKEPDRITPIYVTREHNGYIEARWLCAYCKQSFYRRTPCEKHMGLIPNKKYSCPVLEKEDSERRLRI
jgi:hypothetical protein